MKNDVLQPTYQKTDRVISKKVIIFLTATYGLTWLMWWMLAFLKIEPWKIFSNPMFFILFFIGGLAPTLASYIAIKFSDRDYKSYNKTVLKWRINIFYYLFCIASVLGVRYLSIAVYGFLYKPIWTELNPQYIMLLTMLFPMILMGGLEEFGWRGLLFSELNKKINFIISALIVGLIWALWHLPLFFIKGLYDSSFFEFAFFVIGIGLVLAWLYKKTNSILVCVLFHALINASTRIGLSCPSNGEYLQNVIWLILGASLLLYEYLINRKKIKNLRDVVN